MTVAVVVAMAYELMDAAICPPRLVHWDGED
jgi:hypothetical protein